MQIEQDIRGEQQNTRKGVVLSPTRIAYIVAWTNVARMRVRYFALRWLSEHPPTENPEYATGISPVYFDAALKMLSHGALFRADRARENLVT